MLVLENYYTNVTELKAELNRLKVTLSDEDLCLLAIKLTTLRKLPSVDVFYNILWGTIGRVKLMEQVLNTKAVSTVYLVQKTLKQSSIGNVVRLSKTGIIYNLYVAVGKRLKR